MSVTETERSGEQFARVGELDLCYQTFGSGTAEPLLLVMGLASQMVIWEDDFCAELAEQGFFVIRFDNRDIGRSTIMKGRPIPTALQLLRRDRRAASYSLDEMADDAAGLLEQLGLSAAHVVGASMGGMIAQLIATRHPERVRTLVSIMSTTGNRKVGGADIRLYPMLLRRTPREKEAYTVSFASVQKAIGSRRYPPQGERLRAIAELCFDRGLHPDGSARQLAAIMAAPDRTAALGRLQMPVTVIHGDADRLVKPTGGRATAAAIPGARLVMVPGMAHDLPREVWPQIVEAIRATAALAGSAAPAPG